MLSIFCCVRIENTCCKFFFAYVKIFIFICILWNALKRAEEIWIFHYCLILMGKYSFVYLIEYYTPTYFTPIYKYILNIHIANDRFSFDFWRDANRYTIFRLLGKLLFCNCFVFTLEDVINYILSNLKFNKFPFDELFVR